MADKCKGYSPEVARKAIVFLNLRGVGMMKEEMFKAAKALEPEEEGCRFNFIVLNASVECISISIVETALVKTSVN